MLYFFECLCTVLIIFLSAKSFKLFAVNHYLKQASNWKNWVFIYWLQHINLILQYRNTTCCTNFCRRVPHMTRLLSGWFYFIFLGLWLTTGFLNRFILIHKVLSWFDSRVTLIRLNIDWFRDTSVATEYFS